MKVFNSCGKPGVVVLTFDSGKTLEVKFNYRMNISVTYYKDRLHRNTSQFISKSISSQQVDNKRMKHPFLSRGVASLTNIASQEKKEGRYKQRQLSSVKANKLGSKRVEGPDLSRVSMFVDSDSSHDVSKTDLINLTDVLMNPLDSNPPASTKKKEKSLKMCNGASDESLENNLFNKINEQEDVKDDFNNLADSESNRIRLSEENLKLELSDDVELDQKTSTNDLVGGQSEEVTMLSTLSCQICGKLFDTNEELISHGSLDVSKESCVVCQEEFVSKANLLLHDYLSHKKSGEIYPECPVCLAPFLDNLEVVNHLKYSHTNEAAYKCCVCHTAFQDYHIFSKHLDNFLKNKVCKKIRKFSNLEKRKECIQNMKTCSVVIKQLSNPTCIENSWKKTPAKSSECAKKKVDKVSTKSDGHIRIKYHEEAGQVWQKCDFCQRLFKENWALRNHTKPQNLVDVCKTCGFRAYSKAEYLVHEYTRHSEEYKSDNVHGSKQLKCPVCKEICSSHNVLIHVMSQHTSECPYVCCICDIPLENIDSYTLHMKSHQSSSTDSIGNLQRSELLTIFSFKYACNNENEDKTVCRLCKEQFNCQKDFFHHSQNITTRKVCDICGTPTSTEAGYIVHRYLSHGLDQEGSNTLPVPSFCDNSIKHLWEEDLFDRYTDEYPESVKCPCCPEFINVKELFFHVTETHSHESPFKCCTCESKSSNLSQFIDHCNFHLGKKIYDHDSIKCLRCNLRFESRNAVTQHQLLRHKHFTCTICQTRFGNTLLLEEHLQIMHKNEAKGCSFCGKLFCDVGSLAWHVRNHIFKKKVPCTVCGEVLASKRGLNLHMQNKHSDDSSQMRVLCTVCGKMIAKSSLSTHKASHSNDRPHDCNVCNKSFKHRSEVLRHVNRVHMKHIKCYICDTCGKGCTTRYNLKIHKRIHSSVKAFSCNFCDQGFNYNQSLQAHISRKHNNGP